MNKPAAMQADYVDLRFVKTRKVMQITLEMPIEAGAAFVAAFGTPDPANGVPVAIARLDPTAKPERKGGKLAQRAGILCGEGAFQKFLRELCSRSDYDTATLLRSVCLIDSRADLDHDAEAARRFTDLEASYKAWLVTA